VGVLVAPAELAMRWAWQSQPWWVGVAVALGALGLNGSVWWASTRFAVRDLPTKELDVLARLDPRLNA
ncbi:MAG TPA: hypothetical protein PLV93_08225, partial [Microthrixaceae bacterium]|nr:hypothetical protein [Microthrixaceae bacterium]